MKKLFSFSMLLAMMLLATNSFAYQVYINDPCTNGKPGAEWWNVNKVSDIGAVSSISSDGLPWAAWFYDPNEQIFGQAETQKIEGLSIVETNVIRVDTKGEMFFKMDFYVRTLKESNMRNFGARVRLISSNEWDTIYSVRRNGVFPVYRNGYEGKADVAIGDKYNGEAIIFQIFFYNDALATDAFIVGFRNVQLISYDPEFKVETQLLSRPLVYGNAYNARLRSINQSLASIKSVEYAYSVNGKAEKKQNVTFADTLKGVGAAVDIDFVFDITEANLDTMNRIQLWPVTVDGKAYTPTSGDTLGFDLAVVDESCLDQECVPMLECFTSATCPPCRVLNPYLNPVLAELKRAGKLNVVKYQVNWPDPGDKYYISGNGVRATYYDKISAAPTLILNGTEIWSTPNSPYDDFLNDLREKVGAASQNKAFFTIKVKKTEVKIDSSLVKLDFDITSHLPIQSKNMRVYAMVIEGTTHENKVSNAETNFFYVNMAFATHAEGKASYFSKETTNNYTYTVNMKNTHVEELTDLQVVIFIQDPEDRFIYQSACVLLGPGAAVEDEGLAQVSLYPNPAAHTVYVTGLEKARVEIFDLGGRKVYEKTGAEGVLEVSLASFSKGAYVVRIAQNGAVASRKLVVK